MAQPTDISDNAGDGDCDAFYYPDLSSSSYQPDIEEHERCVVTNVALPIGHDEVQNILCSTYAIVVSRLSGSKKLAFGITLRDTAKQKEICTQKPARILPITLDLSRMKTIADLFLAVKEQRASRTSLEDAVSVQTREFNSLVDVFPRHTPFHAGISFDEKYPSCAPGKLPPMVWTIQPKDPQIHILINFDPAVIDRKQVLRISRQFEKALQQIALVESYDCQINSIETVSDLELTDIWQWNAQIPQAVEICIHELVEQAARRTPTSIAINAWDGHLTYAALDNLAAKLAYHLLDTNIGPEVVVALAFEKTLWAYVSMFAVLKAGGALVTIDISQPIERLKLILAQAGPVLMMTSPSNHDFVQKLTEIPLLVVSEKISEYKGPSRDLASRREPSSTAFLLFTSGSTGTPKGVRWPSSTVSTNSLLWKQHFNLDNKKRVLQFASFSFAPATLEIWAALANGATLCVPSDHQRSNNINEAIVDLQANWACLTPSAAKTVEPRSSSLRTVMFGGESLNAADVSRWIDYAEVFNSWGATECPLICGTKIDLQTWSTGVAGRPAGSACWIVDLEDPDRLAPVGAIGEMLVESPLIGDYIDPEANGTTVCRPPLFLRGQSWRKIDRLYKTGDLVRYNSDGTISVVGRKGTMLKVRGMRIDLGEIEHVLRDQLRDESIIDLVVESVKLPNIQKLSLVAFICPRYMATRGPGNFPVNLQRLADNLRENLYQSLPTWAIPDAYTTINEIPMTTTQKVDRRKLRELGALLPEDQLCYAIPRKLGRTVPASAEEIQLRDLCGNVLKRDPQSIYMDNHFLHIGGDSVEAMRLVACARQQGMYLTVANVLRCKTLGDLATTAIPISDNDLPHSPNSFTLLPSHINQEMARTHAANICQVNEDDIEDIFPCTPLQIGMLATTAKTNHSYVLRYRFQLDPNISLLTLHSAVTNLSIQLPILRVRMFELPGAGFVQAVTRQPLPYLPFAEKDSKTDTARIREMAVGGPISWYSVNSSPTSDSFDLVWTMHHSNHDGWSIPLIIKYLDGACRGEKVEERAQFQSFVQHLMRLNKSESQRFWKAQLEGVSTEIFPNISLFAAQPSADKCVKLNIENLQLLENSFTASTVLRAALAIVLAKYINAEETVFGAVVTGRQAPVYGIEGIIGPTIATVPIRIAHTLSTRVLDLLQKVQNQAIDMIPHEHLGLQHIRAVSDFAEQACRFQTLLVVQPTEDEDQQGLENFYYDFEAAKQSFIESSNTYGLMLVCELKQRGVKLLASFDSSLIVENQLQKFMAQFETVIRQLVDPSTLHKKLSEIRTISELELNYLWRVNDHIPEAADTCVHDIFHLAVLRTPDGPAIDAWDGKLSYRELHEISDRLAYNLLERGVSVESTVPLFIEKSKWMPIAMLAVMKVGATAVALDIFQPVQRLRAICQQVQPTLLVASIEAGETAREAFDCDILMVSDEALYDNLPAGHKFEPVPPTRNLYIVFTSGSTGVPKGVVVSHKSFATALKHQLPSLRHGPGARIYDFVSYSFDYAWCNALSALCSGACLCVPTEHDRKNDLERSLNEYRATFVFLTPSVARFLNPSSLPHLQILTLGGEAITRDDIRAWRKEKILLNSYGPAECAQAVSIGEIPDNPALMDRPLGVNGWVVDPMNNNELAPMGTAGELWLEGPALSSGYVNQPDETAASYIVDPPWLLNGSSNQSGRQGRLYKTGDLVRQHDDGKLEFVGRQDTQVRVRGQRVELGEVEHHVKLVLTAAEDISVVADVIQLQLFTSPSLVVFIRPKNADKMTEKQVKEQVGKMSSELNQKLSTKLPQYMVPAAYIALQTVPMTTTGKTDRRKLARIGNVLEPGDILTVDSSSMSKRQPQTVNETKLSQLWAEVLDTRVRDISAEDNFFRIGGDSIVAMRLVGKAVLHGLSLTVADIARYPCLSDLAQHLDGSRDENNIASSNAHIFENVDHTIEIDNLIKSVILQTDLNEEQIEDISPVTNFQKACLDGNKRQEPIWMAYFCISLPVETTTETILDICQMLWRGLGMLRAIFICYEAHYYQVMTKGTQPIIEQHSMAERSWIRPEEIFAKDLETHPPRDGQQLTRFFLLRGFKNRAILGLRMSHAQYDGISIGILMSCLEKPFTMERHNRFFSFIKHTRQRKGAGYAYWRSLLRGAQITLVAPHLDDGPKKELILTAEIRLPRPRGDVTGAVVFTAACAKAIAHVTESNEVVFVRVSSGRASVHPDLQESFGPCLNWAWVRLRAGADKKMESVISELGHQSQETIPHENVGFEEIVQNCTEWKRDSKFGCVVRYQNLPLEPTGLINGTECGITGWAKNINWVNDTAILLTGSPKSTTLELLLTCRRDKRAAAEAILAEIKTCIESLD